MADDAEQVLSRAEFTRDRSTGARITLVVRAFGDDCPAQYATVGVLFLNGQLHGTLHLRAQRGRTPGERSANAYPHRPSLQGSIWRMLTHD